jgi:hypothetical protein
LASDFLVEDFVRDLVLIPVPFVPQNITRICQPFPRPFQACKKFGFRGRTPEIEI